MTTQEIAEMRNIKPLSVERLQKFETWADFEEAKKSYLTRVHAMNEAKREGKAKKTVETNSNVEGVIHDVEALFAHAEADFAKAKELLHTVGKTNGVAKHHPVLRRFLTH